GPSRLFFLTFNRGSRTELPILPVSTVSELFCWQGDKLIYHNESFLVPASWYEWEPGQGRARPTALIMTPPASFDDIEVVREFATSKDGTKVPLNIMRKNNIHLDGDNPTILTGYGGYGINLTPTFSATRRLWFDAGGIYAVAN